MPNKSDYAVGMYLVRRLEQCGLKHIFGVPGDYVLEFFDRLEESSIQVVGTCNELNAGYAADGYSRAASLGAVSVTYGVGGLSLANAVGGAMAERIPVVVISGSPPLSKRKPPFELHHTFADPDTVRRVFEPITLASISLNDAQKAPGQIDAALQTCFADRGPIYIELPVDMVDQPCHKPGEWLPRTNQPSDESALSQAAAMAAEILTSANKPVVWTGHEIRDFGAVDSLLRFAEHSGYPVFSSRQARGIFPETHHQYAGIYLGRSSRPDPKVLFESAGAVLALGVWWTNINTGGYSAVCDSNTLIHACRNRVKIGQHDFEPVGLEAFIKALAKILPAGDSTPLKRIQPDTNRIPKTGAKLTSNWFFQRLGDLLNPAHILLTDVGGPMIGSAQTLLPAGVSYIVQGYYLSLGYSLPAALGAGLAAPDKRPVILIGDGAFQMTVQEISTMVRQRIHPIIFVLNNDGYQVERAIHDGPYNDIHPWNYHLFPQIFKSGWGRRVETEDDLERAFARAESEPNALALIEVMLDRWDFTDVMKTMFT